MTDLWLSYLNDLQPDMHVDFDVLHEQVSLIPISRAYLRVLDLYEGAQAC